MLEFIKAHQLNAMLLVIGASLITLIFTIFTNSLPRKRRLILINLEILSVILLTMDRFAYMFRGDPGTLGYYMVRISNFAVFVSVILCNLVFNLYLIDLVKNEAHEKQIPMRLRIAEILALVDIVMIIISQFNGMYYTFDEQNFYQRGPFIVVGNVIPIIAVILQLTITIRIRKKISKGVFCSLLLFDTVPAIATVIQLLVYGISLTNITTAIFCNLIYVFAIMDLNEQAEKANLTEVDYLRKEQKSIRTLFDQTSTALANAIDANDKYAHGHSARVAKYSKQIAGELGKSEKEVEEIYYAALLHDVGKIAIGDEIVNKEGKFTPEEYEAIKQHSVFGEEILSSISEYPYLAVGAKYHHERYDGKGYPEGLKGEEIPEIARIIAVADAYDAMTSKRSYRPAYPQQRAREEIIKHSGTQFDPKLAKIMLHLIDLDEEFQMKEMEDQKGLSGENEIICTDYRSVISEGIVITGNPTTLTFKCGINPDHPDKTPMPSVVIFDSLDQVVHENEDEIADFNYCEYGEIWLDGHDVCTDARKIVTNVEKLEDMPSNTVMRSEEIEYRIYMAKCRDHVLIEISNKYMKSETIMALPDSVRYAYLAFTGENCRIFDVSIDKSEERISEDRIPRIAEEVSYINRRVGDVPNVQINGYRVESTDGIPVTDGLEITFHTMSLPTARLIWHTAFISLYYSDDRKYKGPNYREFSLLRLDGENWESDACTENTIITEQTDEFEGWDAWKALNKKGFECTVSFKRRGNSVVTTTANGGISIKNTINIKDEVKEIYVLLSGDQVALTDIRIRK